MPNLIPLFAIKDTDGTTPVLPTIRADGAEYKAASYIETIAKEIEPAAANLVENKNLGYTTVGTYILLETLTRVGLTSLVERLLDSPEGLYQASLFVSIGMLAGEQMPAEVEIGTETSDSTISLRSLADRNATDYTDPNS
jgi:hypothetical protein